MKEHTKKILSTLKTKAAKLPQQKHHIDFLAAILTIPMLITVIIINFLNLQNKTQNTKPTVSPTPIIVQVDQKTAPVVATSASPTPTNVACKQDIGSVSIASPQENQTVTANPLTISIVYNGDGYCAVAWAYKINNGDWSNFDNTTSVAAYNLPPGANTFTLQVKSLVADKSQTIIRHFTYASTSGSISPTPTGTPTPTVLPTQ